MVSKLLSLLVNYWSIIIGLLALSVSRSYLYLLKNLTLLYFGFIHLSCLYGNNITHFLSVCSNLFDDFCIWTLYIVHLWSSFFYFINPYTPGEGPKVGTIIILCRKTMISPKLNICCKSELCLLWSSRKSRQLYPSQFCHGAPPKFENTFFQIVTLIFWRIPKKFPI